MIDLFRPYVPRKAIEAVEDVLRTRWIGQGPKVDQFEKDFSSLFHVKHPIAVNSGTSALETAYDLCDLGPGDEVITTPLTCTATNLPLIRRGVKLVWADIRELDLNIDEVDVERKITEKTKAIVQVHLGGVQSNVKDDDVPVISDACQALGIFNGTFTACSFQAIKHITTGDGGMLVCPDDETAHEAKLLRWFGIDREKKIANKWQAYTQRKMTFDIEIPGAKRQMNDMAAAMGIVGLAHYAKIMKNREQIFKIYKEGLRGIDGIRLVDGVNNTYWLATVIVDRRDDFAKSMFEANVDTNVVQVRNDIYKVFGGERADLPVMNKLEDRYLSLPLGMHVQEDDANYICDMIKKGW